MNFKPLLSFILLACLNQNVGAEFRLCHACRVANQTLDCKNPDMGMCLEQDQSCVTITWPNGTVQKVGQACSIFNCFLGLSEIT